VTDFRIILEATGTRKSPTMSATTTLSKQPLFSTLRRGLFQSPGSRYLNTVARRPDRPFHMAVIGAGPAGFYTAYRVLSKLANAKVDMYESLPVPYGLVRFGVAPDHPEVKVPSSPSLTFTHSLSLTTTNYSPHKKNGPELSRQIQRGGPRHTLHVHRKHPNRHILATPAAPQPPTNRSGPAL